MDEIKDPEASQISVQPIEPEASQTNVQQIEEDASNKESDADSISFNFKSFDGFLDKAIGELQTSQRSSLLVEEDGLSSNLDSERKEGSTPSLPSLDFIPVMGVLDDQKYLSATTSVAETRTPSILSLDCIPVMGVLDDQKYNISATASIAETSIITESDFNVLPNVYQTGQTDSNRESGVESDSDNMAELAALLNTEIPEGRNSLLDSHTNLERVAEYCEGNYFQAENKRIALEETKNYTTQSLASVAYQINTLAYNFLQLLDLQTSQLSEMEGQMNHIAQMVMIHKEKVARREIGVLTANKTTNRQYKIIAPASPEKPIKYVRKPIDFNALDDIGHGVRSNMPRSKQRVGSGSQSSIHPPNSSPLGVGPAPTTKPPTPPSVIRATGSLNKSSREYRTPPAVAPPQVPSHYAPNYPIGHPRRERGPGYSTLPHASSHHSPQVGMVHPQPQQNNTSVLQINSNPQNMPPPPSPLTLANHSVPGMEIIDNGRQYLHTLPRHSSNSSPPLPPPPEEEHARFGQPRGATRVMPIIPDEHDLPGWVPKNYIEKVVAIYDYFADKEDELSFQESAVIYVLKKNDDGWWEGVMDGTTGLFPGNYVEPCV